MKSSLYTSAGLGDAKVRFVEIDLRVNRVNGENIPQLEGAGFIVDSTDFPVQISTDYQNAPAQAFVANRGLRVMGAFRGLTLTHPPLVSDGTHKYFLRLIILQGTAIADNVLQDQNIGYPVPPVNIVTDTAVAKRYQLPTPQRARVLTRLSVYLEATSITSAFYQVDVDSAVNAATAPVNLSIPPGALGIGIPLAGPNRCFGALTANSAGTSFNLRDEDIVLPVDSRFIDIQIVGVGMAVGGAFIRANFR